MNDNVKQVLLDYVKEINGIMYFCGDDNNKEDFTATKILAQACSYYLEDVEEELYTENKITCYNCRYRRWANTGFSCYKSFLLK